MQPTPQGVVVNAWGDRCTNNLLQLPENPYFMDHLTVSNEDSVKKRVTLTDLFNVCCN